MCVQTNVRTTKQATITTSCNCSINYYKMMWQWPTYIIVPLLELSGYAPLVWEQHQEQAFNEMKALLMHVNAYPALHFPFDIYTDTSNYWLVAAIILALVLVLKEDRLMLLGIQIMVHINHKNLTFWTMLMQWVLCWWLYQEKIWYNFTILK